MSRKIKRLYNENRQELIALLIFVLVIITITIFFQSIGIVTIREWIDNAGFWGPVIFISIHTISIVIAPLEGSILMFTAGSLFGYWRGVLLTILAGILGSSTNFWIARKLGARILNKLVGKKGIQKIEEVSDNIDEHPILLIPLMATALFDIVGYAAGLTKVKYRNFLIAVLISSFVNVPIYVAVGQGFLEGNLIGIWIFVILVCLVGLYFLIRHLNK